MRRALESGDEWLSLAFVRDEEMRALNARYRGEEETTDVLAFPLADSFPSGGEEGRFLGEVVLCADEVLRQAQAESIECGAVADRLLVHGVLHLKGHDHYTEAEAARMRAEEERMARLPGAAWLFPKESGNC